MQQHRRGLLFCAGVCLLMLLLCGAAFLRTLTPPADSGELPAIQAGESKPTKQKPAEDWRLILVNPWNPIPEDYSVTLTQLQNGQAVDSRCYPDLQEMLDACRAAGLSPLICSSYRTQEYQQGLFDRQVDKFLARGYTREKAMEETAAMIARPGTSEHQLGLAVDIVDVNNQNLNTSQENTAVQRWLMEHCWEYGFILRYPAEKRDVTGIIYEPWHYRYVGRDYASAIRESGLCLEEFLETIQ